jgi:hypothetical protein
MTEFDKLYEKCTQIVGASGREAYDLAERMHKKKSGSRRYKNHNTYKAIRCRKKRATKLATR